MVGGTGRFILVSCKPNNVHRNGVINYLVYCLHGLLGADTPHQCPDGMRGNKMAVSLVVSRHRKGPTLSGNPKPLGIPLEGIRPAGTIVPLVFQPSGKESAVGRLLASDTHENYVNTVILFK